MCAVVFWLEVEFRHALTWVSAFICSAILLSGSNDSTCLEATHERGPSKSTLAFKSPYPPRTVTATFRENSLEPLSINSVEQLCTLLFIFKPL
jgi:hypothetical protein